MQLEVKRISKTSTEGSDKPDKFTAVLEEIDGDVKITAEGTGNCEFKRDQCYELTKKGINS